ncbi:MAG: SgcJ/EcaC family oxidoreductase [Chloroflexi bacterium]|nr:SgcJ/EcaC family oxidoreductase [Chloroflexota bacterium]
MNDNETIVREFCQAWEARDVDAIVAAFTEDGVYHNIPMQPAVGRDAIRGLLGMILTPATDVRFQIKALAVAGDTVLTERVDTFVLGEKTVSLPVMGAFELREGKIAAWRDYFDLATWTRQTA